MEDFLNFVFILTVCFILSIAFLLLNFLDFNEKECYQYYKENNGYILNSCEKYAKKWSDFNEFKTKK